MKDVYIIIPVYKGLEETRACLTSVLSCSPGTEILVIDDASPDTEIQQYVTSLKKDHTRVHVFRNPVNKGFVKSVNHGFDHDRQKDVIVLNSDTIVTFRWVEKLRTWAYADPRAATVTPMSNSATICSYPVINRCNALPEAFSPNDLNALFETSGTFQRDALIEIPTGIGFCLYIKREFLNKAGYFNDTLFGTGYGEENDFCLRCIEQGARHLAATDTFVYHREGVSFSKDQKQKQTAHAIKVLNQTYPGYDAAIQQFLESDPLSVIRKKTDMLRFSQSGKKGILLISHGKGGGVEKHIRELAEILERANLHPFVLTPLKSRGVVLESAAISDLFNIEIDTRNWLAKLVTLLKWLGICHLHFHHLLDYHEDIYQLPERSGLTFDVTLHDFFMFCPSINGYMEDIDYYCGFEGPRACKRCVKPGYSDFYHVHSDSITLFREKNATFLKHARNIIAPSQSTRDIYRRYFPSLDISVYSHPELLDFFDHGNGFLTVTGGPFNDKNRMNIGLLGGLSLQKGRRTFEECITLSRKKKMPVRWILIGCTDLSDAQVQNDYIITGRYQQKDLPELFLKYEIHVMLLPAKWPETFSYTLSECFALKCPVMVPDIGALGERVRKNGGGDDSSFSDNSGVDNFPD